MILFSFRAIAFFGRLAAAWACPVLDLLAISLAWVVFLPQIGFEVVRGQAIIKESGSTMIVR